MTVLEMIAANAAVAPETVAIEDAAGASVTYGELIARVTRAARGMARGAIVGPIVEVAAERSVAFVVGCLAAWAAGAAWMPIDPREPAWRLAAMRAALAGAGGGSLAYVIATSGSSGQPKLVMVGHRGVAALLRAQIEAFELGPGARSLWLHAPRFDASLSDWGTALASGATLVLPRPGAIAGLRDELVQRAITYVDLPPALLAHLPPEDPPPGLRVVALGGEPCPIEPLRALARRLKVVVVYGPTEATVCSSLVAVDPARWTRPLIGAPLPGVRYRVVEGELWIGGACLALGYADAAATARQFVDDGGARWYRTGDRVEPCDGGLAFVGRIDRQRKLAGVRIELDEIEAVLRRAPGVREAAATVRPIGGAGRARLVAFVDGTVGDLRAWLRREAPPWMQPARIVVGALPRTATGKVDHAALMRCALPVPLPVPGPGPGPGGDVASRLAALWCEAIGIAEVTGERFRDAGGDSLAQLSLQAAAAAHGLRLPAGAFAGDPTFDELLAAVGGARAVPMTVAMCEARGLAALGPLQVSPATPREGAILLTGATGQLGRAMLAAWRATGEDRPIIALVRDPARHALGEHVQVVRGDLSRPGFGLDPAIGPAIGPAIWRSVSTIVHAAAHIELGAGWDAHAAANVDGTAEVARLAAAHGLPWHHISTLSVFVSTDHATGLHREAQAPIAHAIAHGGYAQTKLAAEAIARTAGASTILRLGLLVGGTPRTGDQLAMTVRGLVKLGGFPATIDTLRFDVTPLDHAAAAIIAIIALVDRASAALDGRAPSRPQIHHLASPTGASFADLITAIRATGAALDEIPAATWAARARDQLADPDIAMAYLSLGRAHAPETFDPVYDLFLATGAGFDVARTAALLAAHHLRMPPPTVALAALVHAALEALA